MKNKQKHQNNKNNATKDCGNKNCGKNHDYSHGGNE